ncbi:MULTISPECIES: SDR family oxidoreductase [unclassified Brenneria]|uniref:SDR family oxidoreductase n=1 Tax=unclassified Brenneria TaxID=2634434 RepID=UPI0029C176B0|nr:MULTISPECIES: SDR family oxidoreductase [unclassified Brenneria]MDX5629187.1 SDR family oxidoreductase [Brenneria sp. L3-3Z]MDX5696326.1 SDR family oxidoreductase [Brenneria sp. L4-2C]
MTWLLFGAGQGVGGCLLQRAIECEQPVVVMLRDAEQTAHWRAQGISVVQGDACDADAVAQACRLAGPDAIVVSTLGGGAVNYLGHRVVIDGAEQAGIKRMLLVTSMGCGEQWPLLSPRAKAAFGLAVREKSLAESWLQTSTLDYCIVRPGGLLDVVATHNARLTQGDAALGLVSRQDVALTVDRLLQQPKFGNQIYSLIDPDLELPLMP